MSKRILGVIPARFQSSRFPGKALAMIAGKTMVHRVYERAIQARGLTDLLVATDDERIWHEVRSVGGKAEMTRREHPSGTDRLLEIADRHPDYDAYLNIQGDEPLIDPRQIDLLCELMFQHEGAFVGTLVKLLDPQRELDNPNTVKVVVMHSGQAIYFSRYGIPFQREAGERLRYHQEVGYLKHIGMYGYSAAAIPAIRSMPRGHLEQAESLEQLRWLEAGMPIYTALTEIETIGVDVPEDLEEVLQLLKAGDGE